MTNKYCIYHKEGDKWLAKSDISKQHFRWLNEPSESMTFNGDNIDFITMLNQDDYPSVYAVLRVRVFLRSVATGGMNMAVAVPILDGKPDFLNALELG